MPNLLVVDDDRASLHMFLCAFQGTEVGVETAQSAEEGMQAFERQRPDAVVLDVVLPGQSGMECFARLHELDPRVPVIFVTALGGADTAIEAMKRGAFDYLIKPLDLMKIRALLTRAFEIRRLAKVPVKLSPALEESESALDLLVGNLYYRLNTYTINLPPLRERTTDIPPRVRACVRRSGEGAQGDEPRRDPLESFVDNELAAGGEELYAKSLAIMERSLLARVLQHTGGNQSRAAKLLGITRGSLRNKIRLLRITIRSAVSVKDDPRRTDA